MIVENILDSINLPIAIWTPDETGNLICNYINSKMTEIQKGDMLCNINANIYHQIVNGKTSITICDEKCMTNFSQLINKNYLEIHYPKSGNVAVLSTISKRLKEPMTDIINIMSLFEKLTSTDGYFKYVPLLKKSSYNLICIANDIVDLIQLDSDSMELDIKPLNLSELLKNCIQIYATECEERQIYLHCDIKKNVPTMIMTDCIKLRQIINNLLKNAIKSTENGQIVISITIDSDNLLIKIKDSGSGMDIDCIENVEYILNVCINSSQLKTYGLGLFIANKLCQLLGGVISFKSVQDMGTIFSVSFGKHIIDFSTIYSFDPTQSAK